MNLNLKIPIFWKIILAATAATFTIIGFLAVFNVWGGLDLTIQLSIAAIVFLLVFGILNYLKLKNLLLTSEHRGITIDRYKDIIKKVNNYEKAKEYVKNLKKIKQDWNTKTSYPTTIKQEEENTIILIKSPLYKNIKESMLFSIFEKVEGIEYKVYTVSMMSLQTDNLIQTMVVQKYTPTKTDDPINYIAKPEFENIFEGGGE